MSLRRWLALTAALWLGLSLLGATPHRVHHVGEQAPHCPLLAWAQQHSTALLCTTATVPWCPVYLPAPDTPPPRLPYVWVPRPSSRAPPLLLPRAV